MEKMAGKVAVVLGASMRDGTGGAVARRLRDAGCDVVIAARREAELASFAESIGAIPVRCDATDEDQVAALAEHTASRFGRIDIAVNAAGAPVRASVEQATRRNLQDAIDLNYFAHVWFIRHMTRHMERGGAITIVSSMSGTCVTDGTVFPYSCAKAAANCLVQCAAVEYGPRGIRVNAVLPGPIESAASQGLFRQAELRRAFERKFPWGASRSRRISPTPSFGCPALRSSPASTCRSMAACTSSAFRHPRNCPAVPTPIDTAR